MRQRPSPAFCRLSNSPLLLFKFDNLLAAGLFKSVASRHPGWNRWRRCHLPSSRERSCCSRLARGFVSALVRSRWSSISDAVGEVPAFRQLDWSSSSPASRLTQKAERDPRFSWSFQITAKRQVPDPSAPMAVIVYPGSSLRSARRTLRCLAARRSLADAVHAAQRVSHGVRVRHPHHHLHQHAEIRPPMSATPESSSSANASGFALQAGALRSQEERRTRPSASRTMGPGGR